MNFFVENEKIRELMNGAIDMHMHTYPEFSFKCESRLTDLETALMAKEYGMRGIVLKSQMWPTTTAAYYLKDQIEDFEIFPSITLNPAAGGISAWAVEAAVGLGARVVWFPTWGSASKMAFQRLFKLYIKNYDTFKEEDAISILDENGKLKQNVCEVIETIKYYDLPLFTGHISVEESLALVKQAHAMGLEKIVMDHPDSNNIKATEEQISEFIRSGGFVEYCALGVMPSEQRIHPKKLAEIINNNGAEHFIIGTDSFFNSDAPVPEMIRMCISALMKFDIQEDAIRSMIRDNPYYLLGLS